MMDWLAGNWRDAILIVVGLLGIYMVLGVMRLIQISRGSAQRLDLPPADSVSQNLSAAAYPAESPAMQTQAANDRGGAAPADHAESDPQTLLTRLGRWAQPMAPAPAPVEVTTRDFADELRRSNLEVEVAQLRRESAALGDELASVHEELALLKSTRNISPLYSEAANLAQRGVPIDGIAGQCGISLGEAELVAALARADGRREPAERSPMQDIDSREDGHGGFPQRRTRTGTNG